MIVARTKSLMIGMEQGQRVLSVDLSQCCGSLTSVDPATAGFQLCVTRTFNDCESFSTTFDVIGIVLPLVQFEVPADMDTATTGRYEYSLKDASGKVHQEGPLVLVCPVAGFKSDSVSARVLEPLVADGAFEGDCNG